MPWTIDELKYLFTQQLPGWEAQLKMAPGYRPNYTEEQIKNFHPKMSAVLALFYQKQSEWHLVLIQRRAYEGVHSRQVSFPGGKQEYGETLQQTALRETQEEIGIAPKSVEVIGTLTSLYIPPSNFLVYPFVGILKDEAKFEKQDYEVEEILEIPIDFFLDENNRTTSTIMVNKTIPYEVPAFIFREKVIWGATACVLSELVEVVCRK